ncbi:MAG: HD domain-containing phosphohydrolase [Pseudomonadota bacterium]
MTEIKEKEYIRFTENDQIDRLLNQVVSYVKEFTEGQVKQIRKLTEIGVALSAEKNLSKLLEMIVDEARALVHADGGTLYIMNKEESDLNFAIVQNASLNVRMGGTSGDITWYPVKLKNPDESPNYANVSAYAALTGEVINIPDVYTVEGFNFEGTRKFDSKTGYCSTSMLVVPMRDHENTIIGVLQLINAKDILTGEVIPFSFETQKMTESLASQAAVAITNNRLIRDLENLFEAFIRTIATAIDEKSHYTAGHIGRVSDLVMIIAERINEASEGHYAGFCFNKDQMRELHIAAWLHDVGKVTTPEYVVDKATKLETIYDRINTLKTRFEILKRDAEIELLRSLDGGGGGVDKEVAYNEYNRKISELDSAFNFLKTANIGTEFMADDKIEMLKSIAGMELTADGRSETLVSEEEVANLSIRQGTLNEEERKIISNHAAVTYKILCQLPFPKALQNVPDYASAHHERLDGSGYPFGLKGEMLPLQARIIALTDIFEALTAKDRPYKKGKTLSEAMKILRFMAKDNHIDPDLFDFFVKERIYMDYAQKELDPEQIDEDKLAELGFMDGKNT